MLAQKLNAQAAVKFPFFDYIIAIIEVAPDNFWMVVAVKSSVERFKNKPD